MALQGPFFGKRDGSGLTPSPAPTGPKPAGGTSALGSAGASAQPFSPPGVAPATPAQPTGTTPDQNAATLTVGRNIKLKGVEITDCDTLVVEGQVEATMKSRVVQITDSGSFKGSVEVKIAEVHGAFDGDLTATDKLVIFASGQVTGKIKYGKIVIEEGGQISGEIQSTGAAKSSSTSSGSTGSTGSTSTSTSKVAAS